MQGDWKNEPYEGGLFWKQRGFSYRGWGRQGIPVPIPGEGESGWLSGRTSRSRSQDSSPQWWTGWSCTWSRSWWSGTSRSARWLARPGKMSNRRRHPDRCCWCSRWWGSLLWGRSGSGWNRCARRQSCGRLRTAGRSRSCRRGAPVPLWPRTGQCEAAASMHWGFVKKSRVFNAIFKYLVALKSIVLILAKL